MSKLKLLTEWSAWETTNKEWNPETNRFNEVPLYTEEQAREALGQ